MSTETETAGHVPAVSARPATVASDLADHLRRRVEAELADVQRHVALATVGSPDSAKQLLRHAHEAQRTQRLEEASTFIRDAEERVLASFADGAEVDPAAIDPVVVPVRTPGDADLFRFAALHWSVPVSDGYGRRTRFLIRDRQNNKLAGIFALGDPVIAQAARDRVIGWNKAQRHDRLYNVYDAYVLGAVEPYRQLLGGKLAALLTLSNETRDFVTEKYSGSTTGIAKLVKDPTPVLITTSSALGRSSVYNRVTFGSRRMFHSVGYSQGYGHFHFSEALFADLRSFLVIAAGNGIEAAEKALGNQYGGGANWRWRVIRTALELLDIDQGLLQHNVRREVFLAPTGAQWDGYLRGETDDAQTFDLPAAEIGDYYRSRWACARADRYPSFRYWSKESMRLTPQLQGASKTSVTLKTALPGAVEMGEYHLKVGVERRPLDDGANAYLSKLEGPNVDCLIADITRPDGRREIEVWSSTDGPPAVVQAREVAVAKRFRGMMTMDLLLSTTAGPTKAPALAGSTADLLEELLGFDITAALEPLAEVVIGTRQEMLRDRSKRKNTLCLVFDERSHALPAVVTALTGPIALALQALEPAPRPEAPVMVRRPPAAKDLAPLP